MWGRGEKRHHSNVGEYLAPVLAATAMNQPKPCYDYGYDRNGYEHWDIVRDENREFGNIKKEIAETGWTISREADRNFYTTSNLINESKYENARQADLNTFNIIREINQGTQAVLTKLANDTEQRLRDELY
ncbi:MAG: hypothetical protein FWC41_00605, partial [Firmicutes bacterium]|nr:hypothetical protein [Bacillota bacterium]